MWEREREMVIDFRRNQREKRGVEIRGETSERVQMCKYLGIMFDDKLSWKCHLDAVVKKVYSSYILLEKVWVLWCLLINCTAFYATTVSSVLTFGMTCWGGNASKQGKNWLNKNIKKAGGVVRRRQESTDTDYYWLATNKLRDNFGWRDIFLNLTTDT